MNESRLIDFHQENTVYLWIFDHNQLGLEIKFRALGVRLVFWGSTCASFYALKGNIIFSEVVLKAAWVQKWRILQGSKAILFSPAWFNTKNESFTIRLTPQ